MKTARFDSKQLEEEAQQRIDQGHEGLREALEDAEKMEYLLRHPELREDKRYWRAMEHIQTKLYHPPY